MSNENNLSVVTDIVAKAMAIPGVRVDRRSFLLETLDVATKDIERLIQQGPLGSGLFTHEEIKQHAHRICSKRKLQSASTSFATGLPGGWTMAATIPADTLQFVAFNLRIAQEIAYLYDHKDFWDGSVLKTEAVKSELMLYLATMFGVGGAASATRIVSEVISRKLMVDLPKKALTKTFYYPIIKSVAGYLGVKLTKDTFAKGVAKVVPVLGGVVSGGLTYVTMGKMHARLCEAFDIAVDYTESEIKTDKIILKKKMPEVYDAVFYEIDD